MIRRLLPLLLVCLLFAVPALPRQGFYVLALSWQPAFCEGKPNKTECKAMTADSPATRQLSLHGLWPQPRNRTYCRVGPILRQRDQAGDWRALPEPMLSAATKTALSEVMPGTQSLLERHEWVKHGSCYPAGDAEQYFKDSVRLTQAVNASPVARLLASRLGESVTAVELRQAFDEAFGQGAGQRVRLSCERDGDRLLLVEITIGLNGDIAAGTPLAQLLAAAAPTAAGCPAGIVDPAGLQ